MTDLGRKLVLLKTGYFFHKNLFNIDAPMDVNMLRGEGLSDAQCVKLFSDSTRQLRAIDH